MSHDSHLAKLTRRSFLGASTALAAAAATGCTGAAVAPDGERPPEGRSGSPRVLRAAFMTDIHMYDRKGAPEALARALAHCQGLSDPPEMIVTGGDNIMDAYATPLGRSQPMFDLLRRVVRDHCDLPVHWCIGNHDVWGYDKARAEVTGDEPLWGKAKPVEEYEMPGRYYSFDKGEWRFVVLDSTHLHPERAPRYLGRLDEEQVAWLTALLDATPPRKNVAVVSHIPILSVTALEDARTEGDDTRVPGSSMHIDTTDLRHLFERHDNVRLCLSGHTHRIDRIDWRGIGYVCCGAVSGSWWNGDRDRTDEGYMLLDLYADGSFDNRYMPYGWRAMG